MYITVHNLYCNEICTTGLSCTERDRRDYLCTVVYCASYGWHSRCVGGAIQVHAHAHALHGNVLCVSWGTEKQVPGMYMAPPWATCGIGKHAHVLPAPAFACPVRRQIHDELVAEADEAVTADAARLLAWSMESVANLKGTPVA